jgi:3-hydroxyacyl-[acyl-carrier-protein] dehydratase
MLLEDFYSTNKITEISDNSVIAEITLNKDNAIFKGHFPGNPITPGVCMLQIIKNLTAQIHQCELTLLNSKNIKFLALINPDVNPDLIISLDFDKSDEGHVEVRSSVKYDETVALKLQSKYVMN